VLWTSGSPFRASLKRIEDVRRPSQSQATCGLQRLVEGSTGNPDDGDQGQPDEGDPLPRTGVSPRAALGAGLALIALGASVYLYTVRRRRV